MQISYPSILLKYTFCFFWSSVISSCSQENIEIISDEPTPPPMKQPQTGASKFELQAISPSIIPNSGGVQVSLSLVRQGIDPATTDPITEIHLDGVQAPMIQNPSSDSVQFLTPILPDPKKKQSITIEIKTKLGHKIKQDHVLFVEPLWFRAPQITPLTISPYDMVSGDFNGDQILDLAVAGISATNPTSSKISILLGQADHTFKIAQGSLDLPNTKFVRLAAAAFENFGTAHPIDELVILNHDFNYISVYLITLDKQDFKKRAHFTANQSGLPDGLIVADITNDHKLDILLVGNTNNSSWVKLFPSKDMSGKFPISEDTATIITDGLPSSSYAYGLKNLGPSLKDLDLVLSSAITDQIHVKTGKSDGTFNATQLFTTDPILPKLSDPSLRLSMLMDDFTGDGQIDVVVSHFNWNTANILLNKPALIRDPKDIFTYPTAPSRIITNPYPHSMVTGHFHDPKIMDIALLNGGIIFSDPKRAAFSAKGSNYGSLLINDGNGNFSEPSSFQATQEIYSIDWDQHQTHLMLALDINQDQKTDLVIADYQNQSINILLNAR